LPYFLKLIVNLIYYYNRREEMLHFLFFLVNSNFSSLVFFLIRASSLEAIERVLNFLEYTNLTGRRAAVYLALSFV